MDDKRSTAEGDTICYESMWIRRTNKNIVNYCHDQPGESSHGGADCCDSVLPFLWILTCLGGLSSQLGDPANQGEDETHEGNSCISMMTPRCHMNDQENDCSDGSDDGADDEAVEWGATVLLFSCVFVGGHRGALTWLFGLEVGRVVVARCGEGSGSSAGSAATKLAVPRRPRLCVSLPTTARVVMP